MSGKERAARTGKEATPRATATGTAWRMPERPRVAIVVPTPDARRGLTRQCLEAVRETTGHLDVAVEVVESSGPSFRFSRSVNRGLAAHPDADAWVLLNDDCCMAPGWLDAMLETARTHPQAGLVGAVLLHPSGRVQHAGGLIVGRLRGFGRMAWRTKAPRWILRDMVRDGPAADAYPVHYHRLDPRHRLDFLTGACVLVTRRCLEAVGPYDEDFEFGFEDVDHSLRALRAGLELALAVDAEGTHVERASGSTMNDAAVRSRATFHRKWPRSEVRWVTRAGGRRGIHHGGLRRNRGRAATAAAAAPARRAS
jgi:GT2 family glycosyltransferase